MKKCLSLILCCLMLISVFALVASADATPVEVEAFKVSPSAIAIDGQIESIWEEANSYDVDYVRFNYTDGELTNLPEIQVKILWDGADMLYVLAVIKDSTNFTGNSQYWQNDSMEVWVRVNGTTRALRVHRNGIHSGWDNAGKPRWPWNEFKTSDTADGWIAEYKVQLNFTEVSGGTKPQDDKDLYIDFIYNDATEAMGARQALIGFLENNNEGSGNSNENSLAICKLSDTMKGSVLPEDPGENTTGTQQPESTTAAKDKSTTAAQTTAKPADTTSPSSTAAPETTAAAEKGCGASIALTGVAMVTSIAAVVGVVSRKKED